MRKKHPRESSCRLLIHRSVLEFLEAEAAKATRTETGGVLAGTGDLATGTVHVTHASQPGPRARKSMFSFARDTPYCQAFLNRLARESCGDVDYLGEWHKHHERIPRPSQRDILTSTEIALSQDYHVSVCLLIIVGESNGPDSLRCFIVDGTGPSVKANWSVCTKCEISPSGYATVEREGSATKGCL